VLCREVNEIGAKNHPYCFKNNTAYTFLCPFYACSVLFENNKEFRRRIENLENDVKTLWENQLAIFSALTAYATLLIKHKQDIEKLKGGF